ncbi:hypothetical protein Goe16_01930 [Bacillus phage vB_BsuM-Goe16]|nr:hypothetical protein Goe16_01930 [Bacillus phage vB_BsuM-Goe16]
MSNEGTHSDKVYHIGMSKIIPVNVPLLTLEKIEEVMGWQKNHIAEYEISIKQAQLDTNLESLSATSLSLLHKGIVDLESDLKRERERLEELKRIREDVKDGVQYFEGTWRKVNTEIGEYSTYESDK